GRDARPRSAPAPPGRGPASAGTPATRAERACPRATSHGHRLSHLRAQPLERARGARLDRAPSQSEGGRGLLLGQADEEAAREHHAVVLTQAAERAEERDTALLDEHGCLGGWSGAPR